MKNLKKLGALLLTMIMVLSMGTAAMAANTKPVETDTAKASVTNVNAEGVTVTAYKIVKANYTSEGFTGYSYVPATGLTGAVFSNGTMTLKDTQITDLAAKAVAGTVNLENTQMQPEGNGVYAANLTAGSYMVVVTGSETTVYNPMLVSVGYKATESGADNELQTGTVSAANNWGLTTNNAYAKSSEPTVKKTIVNSGSGYDHGDDVAIGTTVNYEIKTNLPSYSKQYTAPKFTITDTLSAGLTAPAKENVTVTATGLTAADYTVDVVGQVITVEFDSAFIAANQGLDITVTYPAVLNEDATVNFDANINEVVLKYSNDPADATSMTEKKDKTYHYTFGIDAALGGTYTDKTQEVFKVDENGTVTVDGETVTVTNPLPGAKFEIRTDATDANTAVTVRLADGTLGKTIISDAEGYLTAMGLDAGTYYLVETEAPATYSLDSTPHKIVITPAYNDNGTLKNYTIKIDDTYTSTYEATYAGTDTLTTIDKTALGALGIKNTKINALPSTGGIGTTIFTIGGCVIMIAAAGMFFASRKKEQR